MKKFNELNKLKTASVATLMLFTAPAAINGLTLAPSVYAAQETKAPTTNKPSTDTTKAGKSKGANVHDGNAKSGKGSKAGHATDGHAGIGGNTGAHDTAHGG